MEEQKKVNPLATEKEGKLIAKFAIPAIISMLRNLRRMSLILRHHLFSHQNHKDQTVCDNARMRVAGKECQI